MIQILRNGTSKKKHWCRDEENMEWEDAKGSTKRNVGGIVKYYRKERQVMSRRLSHSLVVSKERMRGVMKNGRYSCFTNDSRASVGGYRNSKGERAGSSDKV